MKPKKTSAGKKKVASPRTRRRTASAATDVPEESGSSSTKRRATEGGSTPSSTGKRMARKKTIRKAPPKVPSILLEGDQPSTVPLSGPGRRYELGSQLPSEPAAAQAELPEAYGTRQLLLAARDPHWLYAHWDLSLDQQRQFNALSGDRHLVLRV